jgi:hypothetical protein
MPKVKKISKNTPSKSKTEKSNTRENSKSTKKRGTEDPFRLGKALAYLSHKEETIRSRRLPAGEVPSIQDIIHYTNDVVDRVGKRYR